MTVILCSLPNPGIWIWLLLPTRPFVRRRLFPADCPANFHAALHPSKVETGTEWLMPLIWSWKENASVVQGSAAHMNFTLSFKRYPLSQFPLLALEPVQRPSHISFYRPYHHLLASSFSCTCRDTKQPLEGLGKGKWVSRERWGLLSSRSCVTVSWNNCRPRGITLFSSQISQYQTKILTFSRIAIFLWKTCLWKELILVFQVQRKYFQVAEFNIFSYFAFSGGWCFSVRITLN